MVLEIRVYIVFSYYGTFQPTLYKVKWTNKKEKNINNNLKATIKTTKQDKLTSLSKTLLSAKKRHFFCSVLFLQTPFIWKFRIRRLCSAYVLSIYFSITYFTSNLVFRFYHSNVCYFLSYPIFQIFWCLGCLYPLSKWILCSATFRKDSWFMQSLQLPPGHRT